MFVVSVAQERQTNVKYVPLLLYIQFLMELMCGGAKTNIGEFIIRMNSLVKGWQALRNILQEFLESYNEMHASVNLVLFEGAVQHV